MRKINPYLLPLLDRRVDDRPVVANLPDGSELAFDLPLKRPGHSALLRARSIQAEFMKKYLIGDENGVYPLPDVDVEPSEELFELAALVYVMQAAEEEKDRMGVLDLIMLAERAPAHWTEILTRIAAISKDADPGN